MLRERLEATVSLIEQAMQKIGIPGNHRFILGCDKLDKTLLKPHHFLQYITR